MAVCSICDKKPKTGCKLRYRSSQLTKRSKVTQKPNIRKVKVVEDGTSKSINICARCLRSSKFSRAV